MEHRFTDPNAMTQAGLNLIQQALSIYDKDLELALCNQRHGEMFNLPKSLTRPGAKFEDTIRYLVESGEYGDVENAEAFIQEKVDIAKAFEPHYVERIRANGQVISIEGAPLPQGGWVTVYTDITQTKKQENLLRLRSEELSDQLLSYSEELAAKNRQLEASIAALEEAKRELTEIESRTRLTSEMIPAHVAHVDRQGRYQYSNRRLSMVLPERPNDIIGRHISEVLGAPTYNQISPTLREAFLGTPSVLEFTDDLSARRIRVAFTPDVKETGIEGAYILSMDITEETQARNALQQVAKRELAAQLTSGLAHDFANLLTIILGAQSRLTDRVQDAESLALIEATKTAATRGGSLLNTIGDMTGTRNLNPTPTHIKALLEKLLPLAEAALPKNIILKIHNTVPDEAYFLDSGMLQDALLNLILNAKDACGAGGRIKLSIRPVADIWLDFIVTDSGSGFSAKALKHALDPFYTTKGTDGNGLGLTMVYDTAKLAGGD
ncbi:MAG TPA: hybrid sensor histidine kinase/response regulator, partial [Rhodobacteraceae bacterium]|nr:hybrid sensor histidine kinase/response regulator [Paracoccaceae bacterium]